MTKLLHMIKDLIDFHSITYQYIKLEAQIISRKGINFEQETYIRKFSRQNIFLCIWLTRVDIF